MNGIICINKPMDFTSFDVVAIMKGCFATRKVGHGGTLDPMATGVLPIFLNNATKAVDICPITDKAYTAGFKLGVTSDTQDIWGRIHSERNVSISQKKLDEAVSCFVGEIKQLPPMYSAIQVNGKRLYDLARQGIDIERPFRDVNVYSIEIRDFDGTSGVLEIKCSAGTYVRTIIHDIGEKLGTGAVMSSLIRTQSGVFTLEDCYTIEEIKTIAADDREKLNPLLLPVDRLYECYKSIELDDIQTRMFRNGTVLDSKRIDMPTNIGDVYRIYGSDELFSGLAYINDEYELVIKKQFPVKK